MKLILGVMDIAYSDAKGGTSGAKTTGEVAEILESKYHVMETFYELYKDKIVEWLEEAVSDHLHAMSMGAGISNNPYSGAEEKIMQAFRNFLDEGEMETLLAGLTQSEADYFLDKTGGFVMAGRNGVNHRKKKPYAKDNDARPAFIDSGLYQTSMRAWVDDTGR